MEGPFRCETHQQKEFGLFICCWRAALFIYIRNFGQCVVTVWRSCNIFFFSFSSFGLLIYGMAVSRVYTMARKRLDPFCFVFFLFFFQKLPTRWVMLTPATAADIYTVYIVDTSWSEASLVVVVATWSARFFKEMQHCKVTWTDNRGHGPKSNCFHHFASKCRDQFHGGSSSTCSAWPLYVTTSARWHLHIQGSECVPTVWLLVSRNRMCIYNKF